MDDESSREARTLRRIAATLGIPVGELFVPWGGSVPPRALSAPSAAEVEALVRVFALLRDPQARARIIAAAEAELRASGSGGRTQA